MAVHDRGFNPPYWATQGSYALPYSMIFLPVGETLALENALLEERLFDDVISKASEGISAAEIISYIAKKYNVYLNAAGIAFLVGVELYSAFNWIDQKSLTAAVRKSSSGKISITRMTIQGWPSNAYQPWDSNYITCAPYEEWNPVFYADIYDI